MASSVGSMWSIMRLPTPGTALRSATGVVVKNGCAKRWIGVSGTFVLRVVGLAALDDPVFVVDFLGKSRFRAINPFLVVQMVHIITKNSCCEE
jgi:hypothetical protein